MNYVSVADNSTNKELVVEIVVNLESLISDIGPNHENTDASENSDVYQSLRALSEGALLEEFNRFERYFLDALAVTSADQLPITLDIRSIAIPPTGDIKNPRDTKITLVSGPLGDVTTAQFQWIDDFGEAIVRANSDVLTLEYAVLLSPGQQSDLITFTEHTRQSAFNVFTNYIVVGFEHILPKGLDHILFVIGLFLLTPAWRSLALQITTFTFAHSITLALGATKVLSIPTSIVEPLIAASIVFVCVENFLTKSLNKWRIATVFIFGLLHGLGFASVLDAVGLDPNNFVTALFGFNVGVELGQLLIVAICLLLVGVWIGGKSWYRDRFSRPASLLIGLIGAYWFVQRIGI